jgi:hypothetical protein
LRQALKNIKIILISISALIIILTILIYQYYSFSNSFNNKSLYFKNLCKKELNLQFNRDYIIGGGIWDDFRCHDIIEKYYINSETQYFTKNSKFLELNLDNNNKLKLYTINKPIFDENICENHSYFTYLGYLKEINYYFIRNYCWEWSFYYLINKNNGRKTEIIGFPFLSPDNKRIIAISDVLVCGLCRLKYGLEIWKIHNNNLELEFDFYRSKTDNFKEWAFMDSKWINNNEIKLKIFNIDFVIKDITLIYKNNKWEFINK